MINVVLPVAGHAKRFTDCGYDLPKPLIPIGGVPMIKLALDSLITRNQDDYKLIFIVRDDHCVNYDIDVALRHIFKDRVVETVRSTYVTQGTLCSCLLAREVLDLTEPLIVYTPDVCFTNDLNHREMFSKYDGFLLTFKANSPDHSYAAIDGNGLVTRTVEKTVISNDAIVGVYGFGSGEMFLRYSDKAIETNLRVNNEFYVAPVYNLLIDDGLKIGTDRVDKMHVLGTPGDLTFYETHVVKYQGVKKFAICCDHSGYALKQEVCSILSNMGLEFIDFGGYSDHDSDHYDSLKPCIDYLSHNQAFGLAICCTGQGFNIAANKAKGIRSVVVTDSYTAAMGRRHNAANFFCLAAKSVASPSVIQDIILEILNNSFDGGRHATRIRKINNDQSFIE